MKDATASEIATELEAKHGTPEERAAAVAVLAAAISEAINLGPMTVPAKPNRTSLRPGDWTKSPVNNQ